MLKDEKSQPDPPPNAKIKIYEKPKNRKKALHTDTQTETSNYSIENAKNNRDAVVKTKIKVVGAFTVFPSALQDGLWT